MKTNNQTIPAPENHNGVTFEKVDGKFHFTVKRGEHTFTKIVSGRVRESRAIKIAAAIRASLKRGFVGFENGVDNLATGQIAKLTATPTYRGNNFSNDVNHPRYELGLN